MKIIVIALAIVALTNAQNTVDPRSVEIKKGPTSSMASNPDLPSKISMIMLGVENIARSVAFYRDVVGLELQSETAEFAFFKTGSTALALSLPLGLHMQQRAGATEVIFPVESVSKAQILLKDRGCSFLNLPRKVSSGSWAVSFTDPDGHHLTLLGSK